MSYIIIRDFRCAPVLRIVSPGHLDVYHCSIKPKADELKASDLASAIETIKKLEEKLAVFAKTHKYDIQNDPEFRAKFLEMCVPLGVDPLSTSKSFWGAMLGLGEFYYELSVKVAEVCIASRSRNGGIIRYEHLLYSMKQRLAIMPLSPPAFECSQQVCLLYHD